MILEKLVSFVNEQLAFHESRATVYKNTPARQKKHVETAEGMRAVLEYINKTNVEPKNSQKPKQLRLSLTPADLEGIPEELVEELSISGVDRVEFTILALLEDAGGIMSLDQILIGLYHKTKEINKRQTITSRLYRMSQKGLIFSVPSKKGVYSLQRLSEQEAYRLFGRSADEGAEDG